MHIYWAAQLTCTLSFCELLEDSHIISFDFFMVIAVPSLSFMAQVPVALDAGAVAANEDVVVLAQEQPAVQVPQIANAGQPLLGQTQGAQ